MSKPKFNPNQSYKIVQDTKPKFDPNKSFDVVADDEINLEDASGVIDDAFAMLRGTAQGASFGLVDEVTAGAEAAWDKLSGDQKKTFTELYEQHVGESRKNYKDAQENSPISYNVGQVGGAIGSAFIPGMGVLNAGKGASLGTIAAKGALQGGLQAYGDTEKDSLGDQAIDVVKGAALGGAISPVAAKVIPKGLELAGKGINKAANIVDDATNSLLKISGKNFTGVVPEVTERYLQRSNQINNVGELDEIGEQFIDSYLPKLKEHLGVLDEDAWKALDTTPNIDKNDIVEYGNEFVQGILKGRNGQLSRVAGTGADADRIKVIATQLNEIQNAYGDMISESDLKSIVKSLQDLGWSMEGSPKTSLSGQALQQLSGVYNDLLKKSNKQYAYLMEPVQDVTKKLKSLERNFVNQQAPEEVDRFVQKAKGLHKLGDKSSLKVALQSANDGFHTPNEKTIDKNMFERFQEPFELENTIMDRLAANAFNKESTAGSRKTLFGGGIGAIVGGPIGSAVGAVAGFGGDKFGGQVFKQVLNAKIPMEQFLSKYGPKLGNKFSKVLSDAAQRGTPALTSTHFLLMQNDPTYRQTIKSLEDEDE